MRFKRMALITGIALAALLALFIPISAQPPGETRMVMDETLETYIAPPCFNQAEVTNDLRETDWSAVKQSGYGAESACSAERMMPVKQTLGQLLFQTLGLSKSPWEW